MQSKLSPPLPPSTVIRFTDTSSFDGFLVPMNNMNAPTQNAAPAANNARLSEELRKMLGTPYDEVFELSKDGLTYVRPASLFGVPVAKSGEGTAYWQPGWASLDAYVAGEQGEEDLKRRAADVLQNDPDNKAAQKERKLRTDNVSKQRKIREVFGGDQRAHPNQVVAKRYLPPGGLCEQELMYHLGCKMTDLTVLASKNLLGMDPWDFYRWRIGKVLMERRRGLIPGTKKEGIRGVINSLDSENGADSLFREAVIYSARLQGRFASYGPRKKTGDGTYAQCGKVVRGSRKQRQRLPPRLLARPTAASTPTMGTDFVKQRRAEQEKIRAERRARLAQQQSTRYAGVNAYREARKTPDANNRDKGSSDGETAKKDSHRDSHSGHTKSSRF